MLLFLIGGAPLRPATIRDRERQDYTKIMPPTGLVNGFSHSLMPVRNLLDGLDMHGTEAGSMTSLTAVLPNQPRTIEVTPPT